MTQEQYKKLEYLSLNEKLDLIYMWVKQSLVSKEEFKKLVRLYGGI